MSFYPDDIYYNTKRNYRVTPVLSNTSRYDDFASRSGLTSPRYVVRPPSGYSTTSRISYGNSGAVWRKDGFSGSIAPSNAYRDSRFYNSESLPHSYRISPVTYQPQYAPAKQYQRNVYVAPKTGNKIGLRGKSRSEYDLSAIASENRYFVSADRDFDDSDDSDNLETGIGRWNEEYVRRNQRTDTVNIGPCAGLHNLGNTCFMNSILQCLANNRPLVTYFLTKEYERHVVKHRRLVQAFAEAMYLLWNTRRAFAPDNFRYEIGLCADSFAGHSQHDAQEFLTSILQHLSEGLNRAGKKPEKNQCRNSKELSESEKADQQWEDCLKTENSIITDLFMGLMKSHLKCCECGSTSDTFDPFFDLSLPIKKSYGFQDTTLLDCFELFSQEEKLDGQERTLCENCNKRQKTNKRLSIHKFPRILVIHLKRFSQFGKSKLTLKVRCPFVLELGQFSTSERASASVVYDLFAVCNHIGSVSSGHYTATTKSRNTGQWYLCDDDRVNWIPDSRAVAPGEAYILFYELRQTLRSEL